MVTLADSVGRIVAYREVDRRLFEILGAWVADTPEPPVKLQLARHSRHHAERAGLWDDHLALAGGPAPVPGPDGGALDAEWASFLRSLAAVSAGGAPAADSTADPAAGPGVGSTASRLVGVYSVALPALVTVHRWHLDAADPVCDGPVARTLRAVIADEGRDLAEGEELLQAMRAAPGGSAATEWAARRAAELAARLGP